MKKINLILTLILFICVFSSFAAYVGIFSSDGLKEYSYTSIRGKEIEIYGRGIYKDMSSDVAIQGIAQDYVTLFVAVPLLLFFSLLFKRKNRFFRIPLLGVLFYFFVTYLFYMTMAMYNKLFLIYVLLAGLSFFTFVFLFFYEGIENFSSFLSIFDHSRKKVSRNNLEVKEKFFKILGSFLMINSFLIFILWLGVVVPPLFEGSIYPSELNHYTTLIVQAFDLSLLLPLGFIVGYMAFRKRKIGYLLSSIYVFFLTLLMMALCSKIFFMAASGVNVVPVIFIMPTIFLIAFAFTLFLLRGLLLQNCSKHQKLKKDL